MGKSNCTGTGPRALQAYDSAPVAPVTVYAGFQIAPAVAVLSVTVGAAVAFAPPEKMTWGGYGGAGDH